MPLTVQRFLCRLGCSAFTPCLAYAQRLLRMATPSASHTECVPHATKQLARFFFAGVARNWEDIPVREHDMRAGASPRQSSAKRPNAYAEYAGSVSGSRGMAWIGEPLPNHDEMYDLAVFLRPGLQPTSSQAARTGVPYGVSSI
ncbi:hypothetical protein BU26DRAFT_499479 [Trematosphaeria pertusa]|uniref:Uncharacterized protein n=1 Tax=Trematosphaeria pertusa TaxID=390896 RepID=A0A6A6J2K5_9PLEO|nr:uncharacterized protein BU26DRAFT_499479 [Trematosphaeria pertusa]KAF2256866.1 hypothetical protein BU26DRAFT_499479 [Trematosphaeria pertusa]